MLIFSSSFSFLFQNISLLLSGIGAGSYFDRGQSTVAISQYMCEILEAVVQVSSSMHAYQGRIQRKNLSFHGLDLSDVQDCQQLSNGILGVPLHWKGIGYPTRSHTIPPNPYCPSHPTVSSDT